MGSFSDYLESLKNTPEYMAACISEAFSESVWRIRRRQHMTQKDIAVKAGFRPSYVSEILSGRRKLSVEAVCKIAHALNCDVKFEIVPKECGKNDPA